MSFELVLDFELVLLVALVGLVVGAISGIFGVGGGFLIVPALNVLVGIPAQLAVGAGCCQIPSSKNRVRVMRNQHLRF